MSVRSASSTLILGSAGSAPATYRPIVLDAEMADAKGVPSAQITVHRKLTCQIQHRRHQQHGIRRRQSMFPSAKRRRRSKLAACGISGERHRARRRGDRASLCQPSISDQCIICGRREGIFRDQSIAHGKYRPAGGRGQFADEATVGLGRAHRKCAAVYIKNRRSIRGHVGRLDPVASHTFTGEGRVYLLDTDCAPWPRHHECSP